jgi:hypothetical protein
MRVTKQDEVEIDGVLAGKSSGIHATLLELLKLTAPLDGDVDFNTAPTEGGKIKFRVGDRESLTLTERGAVIDGRLVDNDTAFLAFVGWAMSLKAGLRSRVA